MTPDTSSPAVAGAPAATVATSAPGVPAVSRRRAWGLATRPRTLPAALAPVLVGTAVAVREDGFRPLAALACVAVALLLQVAANLANDAFDHGRGADGPDRLGPTRVTAAGLVPARQVLLATAATLAAAVGVGLYLVSLGGWPVLAVGGLAVLSAVAYTGGPFPLGYAGLGDVFVFLFFGLVAVAGTAFVQTGELTGLALAAGVPIGCLATAILVVNNLRDVEGDRRAGKRTLAVRLGASGAVAEYVTLVTLAFLVPVALVVQGVLGPWALLPLVVAPLGVAMARGVMGETGRALNARLAGTARLELLFALLLAAGIVN